MSETTRPAAPPTTAPLPPLPSTLPPVEERAALPGGFRAGGLAAHIKASGRPDLAVVATTGAPAAAAAVFTTNRFAAAPVRWSRSNLASSWPEGRGRAGWMRGVVSTSGCANAATGAAGDEDQALVGAATAAILGCAPGEVLALSTGLIGTRLPLERVRSGLSVLAAGLREDDEGLAAAGIALMTTDSRPKSATTVVDVPTAGGTVPVRVSGIAKGVGMIHPRMATMLAIVLTDAPADPEMLDRVLNRACLTTWNQLTVDGDTSTNDTVYLLASGAASPGMAPIAPGSDGEAILTRAVTAVARSLARQQAADGEGATTIITCAVSGAADDIDARAVARSVVSSSLLKAAVHGRDPNWGRVASAVGNARLGEAALLEAAGLEGEQARVRAGSHVPVDPSRVAISLAGVPVYAGGPITFDAAAVREAMLGDDVLIRVDLGQGDGIGEAFGCDLTEAYVLENSAYST